MEAADCSNLEIVIGHLQFTSLEGAQNQVGRRGHLPQRGVMYLAVVLQLV